MSTKLHVGNIPSTVLEDDLQAIFAKFGPVDTVEIRSASVDHGETYFYKMSFA
jgi:RNA recognition motif-containing protein